MRAHVMLWMRSNAPAGPRPHPSVESWGPGARAGPLLFPAQFPGTSHPVATNDLNRKKLKRHGSLSLHSVRVYGHARLEQTRESLAWSLCHYSAMEARLPLQRLAGRGNWLMEHTTWKVLAYDLVSYCPSGGDRGWCPSTAVMGKLATTDTICSVFQSRLSCYGICLLNIPPNGRDKQFSASHPPEVVYPTAADNSCGLKTG